MPDAGLRFAATAADRPQGHNLPPPCATGSIIFTSDAVYIGDSYGPPPTPAAMVTDDLAAWYTSVEKIRGIAERTDSQVIFGHDSEQPRALRLAPAGHYS